MKSIEKATAMEQFNEYADKVDKNDIQKVAQKIGGMNRGALVKVWDNILRLWQMIKDPEAPWSHKAIALGALVYTVSPIDAIPDVIPVAGLTDDAAVILAAVASLGAALAKYSKKSEQIICIDEKKEEELTNGNYILLLIRNFVSLLSHVAHSDGELSDEEEERSFELIDYFLFSTDGGLVDSAFYDELNLTKKDLKKQIQEVFEQPLPIKNVAKWINDEFENEEVFYFYAYAIANADNDINSAEREFLDYFADLLELAKYEKNRVERNFDREWLSGVKKRLL